MVVGPRLGVVPWAAAIDLRRGRFGTGWRFSARLAQQPLKRGLAPRFPGLIGDRVVGVGLASLRERTITCFEQLRS